MKSSSRNWEIRFCPKNLFKHKERISIVLRNTRNELSTFLLERNHNRAKGDYSVNKPRSKGPQMSHTLLRRWLEGHVVHLVNLLLSPVSSCLLLHQTLHICSLMDILGRIVRHKLISIDWKARNLRPSFISWYVKKHRNTESFGTKAWRKTKLDSSFSIKSTQLKKPNFNRSLDVWQ